jgi:isopenicillin-N epimerase
MNGNDLRSLFMLDPDITFLNHGSFGACPRSVLEQYHSYQTQLEQRPIEFLGRRSGQMLDDARAVLAGYLNADVNDIAFVTNATAGINVAAKSLPLQPGDEVLTTDHEYGSLDYTWEHYCKAQGAKYIRRALPVPIPESFDFVEWLWQGVTPRTRIIYLSHVTSPTALTFPVAEVIRRAREAGILSVIDGAHAPGHVAVDLRALDADFYAGNCHKWLCAPKGSGFIYARRELQPQMVPPWISWGSGPEKNFSQRIEQQGTRDIAAFLCVPHAIEFQQTHDWDSVRAYCHQLASETRAQLADITGLEPVAPDSTDWYMQMVTIPLPACNAEAVKQRMYDEYLIEAPIVTFNDKQLIRVSFQGYNTPQDAVKLVKAVVELTCEI